MIGTIALVLFVAFRLFLRWDSDDASDLAEAGRLFRPKGPPNGGES